MSRIEEGIEINRPVETAFAYTTNAGNWNKWMTILPEAEQTSPGPVGVGTTFRGTSLLMGRSMQWTARATQYEPSKKFGKNITSGSVFIEQHNTYVPTEKGSRFTIAYDVKVSGLMKLLSPVIVNSMRNELRKSLAGLKQILEAD